MTSVLRTKKNSPYAVELVGAGLCRANGEGGIALEDAARVLHELQDAEGKPLEGNALHKAAKKFAEDRELEVGNAKPELDESSDEEASE